MRLFQPAHVAELRIEVSEESLAVLRADKDQAKHFDDFTYVPARVTFDGTTLQQVGLRVKGNSSRMTAAGDAVPFKLDFNRYVRGQKLDGETKVNLHTTESPAHALNEYLSYTAFRSFGVAAPRTGWADVWLNGNALGLYTLVEQVDERMLARHFDDPSAALYKPELPAGSLRYLGDSFADYQNASYEADAATDHGTFLRLVRTLAEQPVTAWSDVIDLDSVLRYFSGNVALGNWDAYWSMGHNYYLFEATPGRMVMLPWDMNLSQGATRAVCPADLLGSMMPGRPGSVARSAPLHDGLFRNPSYHARYLELLQDFIAGAASAEALNRSIDVALPALGDRISESAVSQLRAAIRTRVAALAATIPLTTSCPAIGADVK